MKRVHRYYLMIRPLRFTVIFLMLCPQLAICQTDEASSLSTETDSSTIIENTFFDLFEGKPGKVALYGLVLPGGGQIYNRDWWKLPLVYGLEGFLVYRIVTSTSLYNEYNDGYLDMLDGKTTSFKGITNISSVKRNRDKFRKTKDYSWVFFIGGHLITIFEAFISRHLSEFDISDDLSIAPIPTDLGLTMGVSYIIPLNTKKTVIHKELLGR